MTRRQEIWTALNDAVDTTQPYCPKCQVEEDEHGCCPTCGVELVFCTWCEQYGYHADDCILYEGEESCHEQS